MTDYDALAEWKLKLAAAETLRPDLEKACKAYRHFLDGRGEPRSFSYESYVMNDNSGITTLANAMLDIQDGAEVVWESNESANKQFSITGDQIPCGANLLFPYPETENWQKAIGGHVIWLSGDVNVAIHKEDVWFSLSMRHYTQKIVTILTLDKKI